MGSRSTSQHNIAIQLTGVDDALKGLRWYKEPYTGRILNKAVREGTSHLLNLARLYCSGESGTLRKSLAVKIKRYHGNYAIVGIIGPKSWYSGQYNGMNRVAHKYAHLVEYGREANTASGKKFVFQMKNGKIVYTRHVKETMPKPFVGKAVKVGGSKALAIIGKVIGRGIGGL